MSDAATPLMRQYHSIKQQVPNALLLFRLGDFYELFYEDAITAARELEITLTSRSKEKDAVPMCGVPHHSAEAHIARLVQRGHRVAICEQMEDPKLAKKLVRREVTRVVTPGTATESALLRSHENCYLAAATVKGERAGLAYADVSTGEFRATELPVAELGPALESLAVREVLASPGELTQVPCLRSEVEPWTFSFDHAERSLRDHFRLHSLEGCGLSPRTLAVSAAGAILHYLRDTQKSALDHLDRPCYFERHDAMVLDASTIRNLELVEPLFAGERRDATLISVLDEALTGMGGRLLRRRLLQPCLQMEEVERRLDAVEALLRHTILRSELRQQLGSVLDLERLLAKVTLGSVTPREMLALGRSLDAVPGLGQSIDRHRRSPHLDPLLPRLAGCPGVARRILDTLADEPPATLAEGGTVRNGVSAELDELRDISRNSRQYIAQIEARERARTGIQSLKVRFNNVFGYYLEVSKPNLHLVPADYERKQTLVGAERFTTPELKTLEAKVLEAEERMLGLERELFGQLRASVAGCASSVRDVAAAVGELDVTAALAEVAVTRRYSRPRFTDGGEMRIVAGRHPVIEKLADADAQRFTPNDLSLDDQGKFIAIITGPNMGGKSTYLRQAALIAIMAQMGSFVPATEAMLPLVDRVFTRIGAADNLARGRSTFMVEMTETAVILNTATPRSLIVLDEIGRGTSTYDGLSLAWAVIEHIHEHIGARTLFATHYHELTELEDQLPGVANLNVAVKESGDQILFLRTVAPGRADRSYGIEVARLAALPRGVIERAREILAAHERVEQEVDRTLATSPSPSRPMQIRLFEPVNGDITDRIRRLRLEELRPIDALNLLAELQRDLGAGA